ncbi:aminoacyl-tRNA hydrolase, partial [Planctomycetota bacterium]
MVVGLGNPGSEYVGTRHNMGFKVIDRLGERLGVDVGKKKFASRFG